MIENDLIVAADRARDQRIHTFIVILLALNLPFLGLGLLDLPNSPTGLIRAIVAYGYYAIYYVLLRAGRGVVATYGCILLLLGLIGWGVHDTGGALTAMATLYALLLIGAATVLNNTRATDATIMLCIAGYGTLALYEFGFAPPPVRLLQPLYVTPNPIVTISLLVTPLVALVGIWLVVRSNIVSLQRSTAALERARAAAEASAGENAALAAQVQASNATLLATEARLRETIDALTLPLIPLNDGMLLLPLVGYLDERRSERLVEGLLQGIYAQRARSVVLDITGLRAVDTRTADVLLHAARAARLLGAEVILSGVGATAARALVELGADVGELHVASTLGDALRIAALRR